LIAHFQGLNPSKSLRELLSSKDASFTISFILIDSESKMNQLIKTESDQKQEVRILIISDGLFTDLHQSGYWKKNPLLYFSFLFSNWEASVFSSIDFIIEQHLTRLELNSLKKEFSALSQKTENIVSQFEKDLALAAEVHKSIHADNSLKIPGLSLSTKYIPAPGLGGDYFDVFELFSKKQLGILLADSHTHGMAAALLSTLMKTKIESFKQDLSFSINLVTYLNQELSLARKDKDKGLSFFFGVLDRGTLQLDFTICGEVNFLLGRENQYRGIPLPTNPLLGSGEKPAFESVQLQLLPGDRLFLASDGLTQSLSLNKSEFLKTLNSLHSTELLSQQIEILAQLNKNLEGKSEIADDITLIQLEINSTALYLAQSK